MSFFDRLRPKWKHSDPEIRREAVSRLTDQAVLLDIVLSDKSDDVRIAAVKRITDQALLADIAKGEGPLNVTALEAVSDAKLLIEVGREAESPRVREIAVDKIDDPNTLQRIAACDTEATIRLKARMKYPGPDRMRDHIRKAMSNLPVTEPHGEGAAEFGGSLEDVCGALLRDQRFRINGAVADSTDDFEDFAPAGPPAATPRTPPGDAASSPSRCVELLATNSGPVGEPKGGITQTVFYHIKIWRSGPDSFRASLEERRFDIIANAAAWGRSAAGA